MTMNGGPLLGMRLLGALSMKPARAPRGPVKTMVAVTVSAAEIAEFRKGISG